MKKKWMYLMLLTTAFLTFTSCKAEKETVSSSSAPVVSEENTKSDTIEIVDMAGRTVQVPKNVQKVIPMTARAQVVVYTINPDKLAGWNYNLTEGEKKYIQEKYQSLPNVGGAGTDFNLEEVAKINPEVIIYSGAIDEKYIADAEKVQDQLKIPVVMVTTNLVELPEVYRIVGQAIGEDEMGDLLAKYCQDSLEYFDTKAATIPEEKKVRVYYAEGPEGLESEPQGAERILTLEKIGAVNVVEAGPTEGKGKMQISFEQLMLWEPDAIIIGTDKGHESDFYKTIYQENNWSQLKAVQNKKVVVTPFGPFNWFDRPYSSNRILGGFWLGKVLYPQVYNDYELKEKTQEFYKLFYHYDLSDKEYEDLLKSALLE